MKKLLPICALITVVVLYLCLAVTPVSAFGDEHRNNHMGTGNGQGEQIQNQNQERVNNQ